ncbi:MAG: AAA family ATPase [Planctomycetes bacterium]|nr:AAA family ATPase [Planctomycetota bacterium]
MPRPLPQFHGFVGQERIVSRLRRQLDGAMTRNEPFPPSLFAGPSGIGKTLLATALASSYGTKLSKMTDACPEASRYGL